MRTLMEKRPPATTALSTQTRGRTASHASTFSAAYTHTATSTQATTYSLTAVYSQTHNGDSSGVVSGYRYYSPELGRWLSRDPLGELAGDHLYAFVANAPIDTFDILGELEAARYQGVRFASGPASPLFQGSPRGESPGVHSYWFGIKYRRTRAEKLAGLDIMLAKVSVDVEYIIRGATPGEHGWCTPTRESFAWLEFLRFWKKKHETGGVDNHKSARQEDICYSKMIVAIEYGWAKGNLAAARPHPFGIARRTYSVGGVPLGRFAEGSTGRTHGTEVPGLSFDPDHDRSTWWYVYDFSTKKGECCKCPVYCDAERDKVDVIHGTVRR